MAKSMSHVISVPDIIWKWAQMKSGLTIPATYLRDVLYQVMISDVNPEPSATTTDQPDVLPMPETLEDKWDKIGMGINPLDSDFTAARNAFVHLYGGGEQRSIDFFAKHAGTGAGIRDPRAWLMSWWRKQKPQAI